MSNPLWSVSGSDSFASPSLDWSMFLDFPGTSFLLSSLIVCYLFAGIQTWRVIFLSDPSPRTCEVTRASVRGDWTVTALKWSFVLLWPLFLLAGWIGNLLRDGHYDE